MEIEAEVAARPAVRVNQLGYLPFGPKTATLVGRAPEPVEFTVVAEHGETAYAERSRQLTHFYGNYLTPQMPPDTEIIPISRTIGHDRLVDESSSSSPIPCKWIGCSLELPNK